MYYLSGTFLVPFYNVSSTYVLPFHNVSTTLHNVSTTLHSYRPVSLTSVVCKLFETLIRDHMVEFLVKHKLINTSQHGFLKARSCLTNLLCFLEEITKWVDDGSPVDVVYLDFQKAFEKVPHQRLLLKLKAHGIGNDVINWIEKWLTHRRQRVIVDGEISNMEIGFEWGTTGISIRPYTVFNIYK